MRKLSFLFVVLALAMFSAVFAVSAQEATLPAIDEAEAQPYLGTWLVDKVCVKEDCMDIASLGVQSTMTFNTDNTAVLEEQGQKPLTSQWYMENGSAYFVFSEDNSGPMIIDENGSLVITSSSDVTTSYVREAAPVPGTAELKADAAAADFLGEWFLDGILTNDGMLPANLLGLTGTLTVSESSISFVMANQPVYTELPYELKDGKLQVVVEGKDEAGKTVTETQIFEYHTDNTVLMTSESDQAADNSGYMVFVREAVLPAAAPAEGESGSLSSLLALLGGSGENGAGLDLTSLLGSIDIQAILQNEKVQEILNDPKLSGLLDSLKDENGNLKLDGILNNLGGLLGGSGENGEGGLNLGGLLDNLGGLFGGSN